MELRRDGWYHPRGKARKSGDMAFYAEKGRIRCMWEFAERLLGGNSMPMKTNELR